MNHHEHIQRDAGHLRCGMSRGRPGPRHRDPCCSRSGAHKLAIAARLRRRAQDPASSARCGARGGWGPVEPEHGQGAAPEATAVQSRDVVPGRQPRVDQWPKTIRCWLLARRGCANQGRRPLDWPPGGPFSLSFRRPSKSQKRSRVKQLVMNRQRSMPESPGPSDWACCRTSASGSPDTHCRAVRTLPRGRRRWPSPGPIAVAGPHAPSKSPARDRSGAMVASAASPAVPRGRVPRDRIQAVVALVLAVAGGQRQQVQIVVAEHAYRRLAEFANEAQDLE